ncbi:MAG: hypothetical protein L0Z50_02975 [Verrucomicrobiales bacterium]|nr:hypothetical protein [Verrucomicrobiales bacterium]
MNTSRAQDETHDQLKEISEQIEEGIRRGKFTLAELEEMLIDKTKTAARTTDEYVHENPWTSLAIAGGIGLIIGWLLARR